MSVQFAPPVLFGGTGEAARELVEIGQLPFDLIEFGSSVADRSAQDRGAACEALTRDGRAWVGGGDGAGAGAQVLQAPCAAAAVNGHRAPPGHGQGRATDEAAVAVVGGGFW